ncbi:DUF3592 domain-containing protein [Quadrisphaera setariae]|uniref:DUF3592 domain-containing protein n=1 Tax=Quadrisphaera setariae TaxID=2593304 RepID=A0A5C8ZKJ7_9ACTN|nr:DUF3592 domain-containing protein [Quadrisphaera setariae]TXR57456.1 DUF3592 domain-containing protein [Quadrisphaera setariae]
MSPPDARRNPWWLPFTLGTLLLAIGVGVLVAGLGSARQQQVLTERGVPADAVVTSVDQDGRSLEATLEWTASTGRRIVEAGVQVDGPIVVGRHLTVIYDPRHPGVFVTGDVGDGYLAVLGLGALVALAGGAAVLRGLWARRRQARQRVLETS